MDKKRKLTVSSNKSVKDQKAARREAAALRENIQEPLLVSRTRSGGASQLPLPPGREPVPQSARGQPAQALEPLWSTEDLAELRTEYRSEYRASSSVDHGRYSPPPPRASDGMLPSTVRNACSLPAEIDNTRLHLDGDDFQHLKLQPDHTTRPLWVLPDGRIYFESYHPRFSQVVDFLIAIAEPVSRPEIIHEYQITMLSLSAAVATGIEVQQIMAVLVKLSKNLLDDVFLQYIKDQGRSIGKLKMVLRNNRYYLESSEKELLQRLCMNPDIQNSLTQRDAVAADDTAAVEGETTSYEVNSLRVEAVKSAAHQMQMPLLAEYEYAQDVGGHNPVLPIFLRPTTGLRPYQQRALSKMFAIDGVAKSGIVVLPCGAGKTLLGIAAATRVQRRTLVLTTTAVAVDQWRRQFIQYTTVPPEQVYTLTADNKQPMVDAETKATVLISTYSMMGFTGKRSAEGEAVLTQVQELEWGLLLVDEVQVMPAKTFRSVATTAKFHCCLGLTATLVREDDLIKDLHWLIGPKLYEASWQQLQEDGFIARVRCVEVWCQMASAFFSEYLKAVDNKDEAIRRALWTSNPNKLTICEYLIRFHEARGDKAIVFSDNIYILEKFAMKLKRYFICGKVDMRERMKILQEFQESPNCNTIFLSKVGDNAIDIPCASVIIQISAHYGSRRQEAQRLGRILRPKPRAFNASTKYNAFFYSLVSRDTQEMYYANRRQQFLVEQGYNYHVLRDSCVERMESNDLIYSSDEAQLQLLKQVLEGVRSGDSREAEDDDIALHDGSSGGAKASKPEVSGGAGGGGARAVEERVSLAGLSGGRDGSYSVTQRQTRGMKAAGVG